MEWRGLPELSRLFEVIFNSVHQKKEEGRKAGGSRKVGPDIEGEL